MSKNLNWVKTRFRLKPKCAGYNQCVSENKHKKYLQIFLKIKLLHINFDLRIIFGWSGYVYKHTQKLMKVARKSAISDVVAAKHKKALRAKAKVVNHCRYQVEAVQKKKLCSCRQNLKRCTLPRPSIFGPHEHRNILAVIFVFPVGRL